MTTILFDRILMQEIAREENGAEEIMAYRDETGKDIGKRTGLLYSRIFL